VISTLDTLGRRLDALCSEQRFETGWCLKDPRRGEFAHRRGAIVVPSASTRKISILMAALREVHAGGLSLDQPVTIQAKYQTSNSGCFQHFRPGFTITLHDVLTMMIIVSDNTCTGTVVDMLGLDALNGFCRSVGMAGTTHRQGIPPNTDARGVQYAEGPSDVSGMNATTPNDVVLLLELILQGLQDPAAAARLGCTSDLCRVAMEILSWQKLNSRLPALLPTGTKVAHKTGTGPGVINDAGIVFAGADPLFILAAYTQQVPWALPDGTPGKAAAERHIARLCRTCWDALMT